MNGSRVLILCRHGRTIDHGCRQCLGPDDWTHVVIPSPPTSIEKRRPRIGRLVLVCALVIGSAVYIGTMASNAEPHGPDLQRQEQPLPTAPPSSSSTLLAPLRADNPTVTQAPRPGTISTVNVPDGRCHEDDPCWDCSTMGNRICGPVKP